MVKIAIDAGHGLKTAGKRCLKSLDPSQTREWYLNDRIADKLEELLAVYDCEILRTDDTTGKTDVTLYNRVKRANKWGADIFISIHHNAGVKGKSGGGTVVYHYGQADDKQRAERLYKAVVAETGLKGNRSLPVAKGNFYVINNTTAPALLLENGFMDSKTDVPIILSEAHAEKTARGLCSFLVEEFNLQLRGDFRVKIYTKLPIRSGPGVDYSWTTQCPAGVFTIKSVKSGAGSASGWGELKSGAGWIPLDFAKRV